MQEGFDLALAGGLGQRPDLLVSVRSVLHLGLHLQRGAADVLHPRRDVLEGTPCVRLPGTEFLPFARNSLSWISARAQHAVWGVLERTSSTSTARELVAAGVTGQILGVF